MWITQPQWCCGGNEAPVYQHSDSELSVYLFAAFFAALSTLSALTVVYTCRQMCSTFEICSEKTGYVLNPDRHASHKYTSALTPGQTNILNNLDWRPVSCVSSQLSSEEQHTVIVLWPPQSCPSMSGC